MLLTHLVPWRGPSSELEVRNGYRDPFSALSNRMERLFGDFFDDFGSGPSHVLDRKTGGFSPSLDLSQTDKEITVSVEVPGIEPKDIKLSLNKDHLTISGHKKEESKDESKHYSRLERCYGSFRRVIALGCPVDQDKTEAEFKNGVLTITLPKRADAVSEPKRIEIKAK